MCPGWPSRLAHSHIQIENTTTTSAAIRQTSSRSNTKSGLTSWPVAQSVSTTFSATTQHEAPPESPIVRRGVIVAFAQTEITRQHGYPGVFQVATDALREEYLDCELHVDAISLRPTAPLNPTFPGP